jgi:hypothetical protein
VAVFGSAGSDVGAALVAPAPLLPPTGAVLAPEPPAPVGSLAGGADPPHAAIARPSAAEHRAKIVARTADFRSMGFLLEKGVVGRLDEAKPRL